MEGSVVMTGPFVFVGADARAGARALTRHPLARPRPLARGRGDPIGSLVRIVCMRSADALMRALARFLLLAPALAACSDDTPDHTAGGLAFEVEVAGHASVDAAPSADGAHMVFIARDGTGPLLGRDDTVIVHGAPLVAPSGVAVDGPTIYVADPGADALFRVVDGVATPLGVGRAPRAVHVGADIMVLGKDTVMRLDGDALVDVASCETCADASALYVASDGTIYLTDNADIPGQGRVVALKDGQEAVLLDGLWLGDPAGITMTKDEAALAISAHADDGGDEVITYVLASGARATHDDGIAQNTAGGGVHRAADVDVFGWADSASGFVYRVSFR